MIPATSDQEREEDERELDHRLTALAVAARIGSRMELRVRTELLSERGSSHELCLPPLGDSRSTCRLIVPTRSGFRKGGSSNVLQKDVCADPVEGVTGPAHTFCRGRPCQTAADSGARSSRRARSRRCSPHPRTGCEGRSCRKKSATMMAIARKPSRIAYSVVVWPSSRSRSSMHCDLQCDERAHQDVGHLEVPPPVRGAHGPCM